MQHNSSTGGASHGTFFADLVARNLETVLAENEREPAPEPVKPLAGREVEALIVSCSEPVKALAWSFARGSDGRVDVEEMHSIGMVKICEAVAAGHGLNAENPVKYLVAAARQEMCAEWQRLYRWSTASLDAPLTDDAEMCLYDRLPAPSAPAASASFKTRIVNDALDHVTEFQRAVLRRRFGLPGYGASNLEETARALHTTVKSVDGALRNARRSLARDYRLCKALGVEVAQ